MRYVLVILAVLCSAFPVFPVPFHGVISHDTTWSDTVHVDGDVVVDTGVCLNLESGTVVLFGPDSSVWDTTDGDPGAPDLIVRGQLHIALGNKGDPLLTGAPKDSGRAWWGGVFFRSERPILVWHLRIEHSQSGLNVEAPSAIVECCMIDSVCGAWRRELCSAISCRGGDFVVAGNSIFGVRMPMNAVAISCQDAHSIVAENNSISGMYGWASSQGIRLVRVDSSEVRLNTVQNISFPGAPRKSWGIVSDSCRFVSLESNLVEHCGDVRMEDSWPDMAWGIDCVASVVRIASNVVSSCEGGSGVADLNGPGPIAGGTGVGLQVRAHRGTIVSNHIEGCRGGKGGDSWRSEFSGAGGDGYGMLLLGASESLVVTRNVIHGCYGGDAGYVLGHGSFGPSGEGVDVRWEATEPRTRFGGDSESANLLGQCSDYLFYNTGPYDVDARYNMWGFNDRDSIAKYIFDGNDSTGIGYVLFEPWLETGIAEPPRASAGPPLLRVTPTIGRAFRIAVGAVVLPSWVEVYDAAGRLVRALPVRSLGPQDESTLTWDGADARGRAAAPGVYFLEVEAGHQRRTAKVLKME